MLAFDKHWKPTFNAVFNFLNFLKWVDIWRGCGWESWLIPAPCAPVSCPVEMWRTRLRFDIRWAETVNITLQQQPSIILTPWSTSITLVFSLLLVTHRLMPSVTVWTLIVCAGVLSQRLSWLLQLHTVGGFLGFLSNHRQYLFVSEQNNCV